MLRDLVCLIGAGNAYNAIKTVPKSWCCHGPNSPRWGDASHRGAQPTTWLRGEVQTLLRQGKCHSDTGNGGKELARLPSLSSTFYTGRPKSCGTRATLTHPGKLPGEVTQAPAPFPGGLLQHLTPLTTGKFSLMSKAPLLQVKVSSPRSTRCGPRAQTIPFCLPPPLRVQPKARTHPPSFPCRTEHRQLLACTPAHLAVQVLTALAVLSQSFFPHLFCLLLEGYGHKLGKIPQLRSFLVPAAAGGFLQVSPRQLPSSYTPYVVCFAAVQRYWLTLSFCITNSPTPRSFSRKQLLLVPHPPHLQLFFSA